MQKFNYHGHTSRCGHAIGTDEEYVIQAIKNGYTHIGFSDHAPYQNSSFPKHSMEVSQLQDYISSVQALKKKYRSQIKIYMGLEIEYYEDQLEELKQYKQQMDYLIVGQHGESLFGKDFYQYHSDEDTLRYGELIEKACESGLPDIIAHPDLFMYAKEEWNEACEITAHRIAKAAQDYQIPLEINLNGINYGKKHIGNEYRYAYPYRKFWEIVSMYDIKAVYGLDAHQPEKYADKECYRIVDEEILNGLDIPKLTYLDFDK